MIWKIVPGVSRYHLQISANADFTTLLYEDQQLMGNLPGDGTVVTSMAVLVPQGEYWWRVRARSNNGQVSAWSEVRRAEVNLAERPANNSVIVANKGVGTSDVMFSWYDTRYGEEHYRLEVASDEAFSTIIMTCTPPNELVFCPLTLPLGTYYWRVAVVTDTTINVPRFAHKLTISQGIPLVPVPITPTNGESVPQEPTLSWGWATMPESTIGFTYEVELDLSPTFNSQTMMSFTDLMETSVTVPALSDNTYYWRVRALNASSIPGPWSVVWRFHVDTTPPAAPTLIQPTENMLYSTPRPTFRWSPVQGAAGYQVSIGYPEGTCDTAANYWVAEQVTTASYTMKAPMPQDTFQVCVRAYDQANNFSSADGPTTFRIFLGTQPLDGAFISAATKPVFRWTAAPVPAGSNIVINYIVQIDNDDDLSNGLWHTSPVLSVNTTSYTSPDLLPAGVYRWRVIRVGSSYDENLRVPEWRTFVIGGPGAGPELLEPTINQVINGFTTLSWNDAVAPTGTSIDSYEVVISRLAVFPPGLSTSQIVSGLSLDYTPPANQNRVTYYWRVRGLWDGAPVTTWTTGSFAVDNVAPAAPVIVVPANNALLSTVRPVIAWSLVPTATNYTIGIADAATGEDLMDEKTIIGLVYTPDFNLPQKALTIRVRANDAVNQGSWSYVTVNVRLGTIPSQNAVVNTTRPTLVWSAVLGAESYTLQIDNDPFFDAIELGGDGDIYRTITLGPVVTYTLSEDEQLIDQGSYYWRLMPSNGTYPADNTSRAFYRAVAASLKPIDLESAVAAENALPSVSFNPNAGLIALSWKGITPTPLQYEIQIGATTAFATVGRVQRFSIEPSVAIDPAQLTEGVKYWRVRGLYSADGTSYGPWSDAKTFTIDRTPPAPPMISGALTSTVSTMRPSFKWVASIGAKEYWLSVFDESIGSPVPGLERVTLNTTLYTVPAAFTALNQNNTTGYEWSVYAVDAAGNVSPAGFQPKVYLFSGISPKKGQLVTTLTPTFQWTAVTGSGAAPWILEIARDVQMTDMVYSSPTSMPATAINFTLPAANALAPGLYYWRVYRVTEDTSTIQGQAFSVGALKSMTPQPLTPAPNSWLNTEQLASGPMFTWAAQIAGSPTTAALAQSYRFEMAKAATFTPASIVYTRDVTGDTGFALPSLALADGTYYWRVQARYTADVVGPFSAPFAVRIDKTRPALPVLLAPVSRAVIINTHSPMLTWSAAIGATSYTIEVASDASFTNIRATKTVSSLTFSFIVPGLPNGSYFWRVSAKDAAGNATMTSGRRLTIAAP
jgi:hypothetical protein